VSRGLRHAGSGVPAAHGPNPGPVYDNAMRLLARRDLVAVCAWLGIATDPDAISVSEALPAATLHADLIAEVADGELAHVEFVRAPDAGMARRMLEYRARIMALHPRHGLTQHVVVLAQGTVPAEYSSASRFVLHLQVTYLRDEDPERLLANPSLAPLAVLARARDQRQRVDHLRRALEVIVQVPRERHRRDLVHTAVTLAGIHLDPVTIEKVTEEAGMPITLDEDTVAGRIIAATAEARGEARGKAEGELEERVRTLATLMRRTFGDDPGIDDLAHRLATLPRERALEAALTVGTLDDLRAVINEAGQG
jgi:hypothetical protein